MSITNCAKLDKTNLERLIEKKDSSISYEKPKGSVKTSKYWSEFSQIYCANVRQDFIICDYCKSILVYKSITGSGCMLAHSRSYNVKKGANSFGQQTKINHFYSSTRTNKKIPKRMKDAITSACVDFVIQDGRPFYSLKGSGFLHMAKQLFNSGQVLSCSPDVHIEDLIPSPTTISRSIDRMYVYYKEQLIKFCQSMDNYCLIVDFWTESYSGMSYCGLSISHIDLQFELFGFLLGCYPYQLENKRTSTIRSFIDSVLNDYGLKLNQETFILSDNEATMRCAFNSNCKRIGCSDHYLNKQIQHAFISKTIDGQAVNCKLAQETFGDVKYVVSSVRRMHQQQNLSKKLILYADTRFGGAFDMMNVFVNVFDELAENLDLKLFAVYAKIDKDFLFDICEFLSPFITVFEASSDSKRPTIHHALPFKQLLMKKCQITNDDKQGIKELKSFLVKRLEDKWELSNEHLIASLIYPNLKHFDMCPQLEERAILLLKKEMIKHQDVSFGITSTITNSSSISSSSSSSILSSTSSTSYSTTSSIPPSTPASFIIPISITNQSSVRKKLLMGIYDKPHVIPEKTNVEQELQKYLASTIVLQDEEDDDILSYWKEHQKSYPLIALIARKVLAIPASNTIVERLFSSCKKHHQRQAHQIRCGKIKQNDVFTEKYDDIKEKLFA